MQSISITFPATQRSCKALQTALGELAYELGCSSEILAVALSPRLFTLHISILGDLASLVCQKIAWMHEQSEMRIHMRLGVPTLTVEDVLC